MTTRALTRGDPTLTIKNLVKEILLWHRAELSEPNKDSSLTSDDLFDFLSSNDGLSLGNSIHENALVKYAQTVLGPDVPPPYIQKYIVKSFHNSGGYVNVAKRYIKWGRNLDYLEYIEDIKAAVRHEILPPLFREDGMGHFECEHRDSTILTSPTAGMFYEIANWAINIPKKSPNDLQPHPSMQWTNDKIEREIEAKKITPRKSVRLTTKKSRSVARSAAQSAQARAGPPPPPIPVRAQTGPPPPPVPVHPPTTNSLYSRQRPRDEDEPMSPHTGLFSRNVRRPLQ